MPQMLPIVSLVLFVGKIRLNLNHEIVVFDGFVFAVAVGISINIEIRGKKTTGLITTGGLTWVAGGVS